MGFELICARAKGASHIKEGTPCEDFGLVKEGDGIKVFALSDGHGDKSCPRSNIGSQRACEIAISELYAFATQLRELDASREKTGDCGLVDCGAGQQESLIRQLTTSIVGKWASSVIADFNERPLTTEERAGCAQRYLTAYDNGKRLEHIYGATLITGVMTERYILLIQQGDGRCEVFWEDGSVTQPIPWDNRCTANITTSLCDLDAIPSTRYCVIDLAKTGIIAVLAGSDGVEDAFFSMDGTHNFYRSLLARAVNTSVSELELWLDSEYLSEFSKSGMGGYGSQDDVTVCGLIDVDKVRPLIGKMELDAKVVALRSNLKNVEDRLSSMGSGKLEFLQKKLATAVAEEEAAQEEYDSIKTTLEARRGKLQEARTAQETAASATKLELQLLADGVPILKWPRRGIRTALTELARSRTESYRDLELELDAASRRLIESHKKVEPARQELDQYVNRKNGLLDLRDSYQRELDALLAGNDTSDGLPQGAAGDDLAKSPREVIVEIPEMPNDEDCEDLDRLVESKDCQSVGRIEISDNDPTRILQDRTLPKESQCMPSSVSVAVEQTASEPEDDAIKRATLSNDAEGQ